MVPGQVFGEFLGGISMDFSDLPEIFFFGIHLISLDFTAMKMVILQVDLSLFKQEKGEFTEETLSSMAAPNRSKLRRAQIHFV